MILDCGGGGWFEGLVHARVAFWGLSCWWASVALCLGFRFWAWSIIAICGCFCSPEGVIRGSCGGYGSFLAWDGPFWAVGVGWGPVGCVQNHELGTFAHLAFRVLSYW